MHINEITSCVADQDKRMERNNFNGTLRVEIHYSNGHSRRLVVVEEPQRLEFVKYPSPEANNSIDEKNT
jgi:hypothetical protein